MVSALRKSFGDAYLLAIAGKRKSTSFEEIAGRITVVDSPDALRASAEGGDLWYFLKPADAAACLEVWRSAGTRVPGGISVLASRDDPSFYHLGLSSCVTDWRTIGYLMAHAITGDIPVEKTSRGFLRTTVRVYERGTTP